MMTQIKQIGIIHSEFSEPADPFKMREKESTIEIFDEFIEGLHRLEESDYIQVVFDFHRAKEYELITRTYDGSVRGVFASRSPRRPSSLGITAVKLLEKKDKMLRVSGLDAIDGTPVLDIKPHASMMNEMDQNEAQLSQRKKNPRWDLITKIRNEKLEELLLQAGELHGHFCPGLALGVMAGVYLMNSMRGYFSDGLENLLAFVETNSCFSDGVQYITGCTFGNNALIYRDYGKTAVTLSKRDGAGLRVALKADSQSHFDTLNPKFTELFEKVITNRQGTEEDRRLFMQESQKLSFLVLQLKMDELFTIAEMESKIPSFAPIEKSIICEQCKESVMSSRIREKDGKKLCIPCAKQSYFELNGGGIKKIT